MTLAKATGAVRLCDVSASMSPALKPRYTSRNLPRPAVEIIEAEGKVAAVRTLHEAEVVPALLAELLLRLLNGAGRPGRPGQAPHRRRHTTNRHGRRRLVLRQRHPRGETPPEQRGQVTSLGRRERMRPAGIAELTGRVESSARASAGQRTRARHAGRRGFTVGEAPPRLCAGPATGVARCRRREAEGRSWCRRVGG